jgi:hypothetical protein
MVFALMLMAAVGLAAVNTWQRRGRTPRARQWARGPYPDFAQRNVLEVPHQRCVMRNAGANPHTS